MAGLYFANADEVNVISSKNVKRARAALNFIFSITAGFVEAVMDAKHSLRGETGSSVKGITPTGFCGKYVTPGIRLVKSAKPAGENVPHR